MPSFMPWTGRSGSTGAPISISSRRIRRSPPRCATATFGLTGLVTFPSFHAASALLYTWAFWPARWMRPVAVIANGLMLASTPIDGGHYFIDIFAGIAVAVFAIAAAHAASRALKRRICASALRLGGAMPLPQGQAVVSLARR